MAAPIVVEESFDLEGRGAAVVDRGAELKLRTGAPIAVRVLGAGERSFECTAFVELVLRRTPSPHERHALLLVGISKSAVPAGTELEVDGERA
ncbi:MAG: hypothetical protein JNK82_32085 [Myxococcaceae bacterium]|nr:hypothetical protein [Myxococcaceae bacterium]